ncbi:hypothetical protein ACHAXS_011106 [Conticribra weissflogii]
MKRKLLRRLLTSAVCIVIAFNFAAPNISPLSSVNLCDCDCKVKPLTSNTLFGPGEINRLRRNIALGNPSCYERHFATFADHFKKRITNTKRHLFLHVPKTGGTSICELAEKSGKEVIRDNETNCWEREHFWPLWCCYEFSARPSFGSCREFDGTLPEFVMNENFLDYPLCMENRIYSTLVRDPVDRVISHQVHLRQLDQGNTFHDRLNLGVFNHFNWALTAGLHLNKSNPIFFSPVRENLEIAMDTMSRFDFIIDLFHNVTCNLKVMNFLGFGHLIEMPRKNKLNGTKSRVVVDRQMLEDFNSLDRELYDYALKIVGVDCEFFLRL